MQPGRQTGNLANTGDEAMFPQVFIARSTFSAIISQACALTIMEPFGVLGVMASIIACIGFTKDLLKRFGPSDHQKRDLEDTLRIICGFQNVYEVLKEQWERNEEDQSRFSAPTYIQKMLQACKETLDLLEARLQSVKFIGRYIVGKSWDQKFRRVLYRLETPQDLLNLILHVDQLVRACESYHISVVFWTDNFHIAEIF